MPEKTERQWLGLRTWCEANPGKRAAVVTPKGVFTVTFEARRPDVSLQGIDHTVYSLPWKGADHGA